MLEYSSAAKAVRSKFFEYRNDVDIYTEDKNEDKWFYLTILKRLVKDDVKINDVYPLGPKNEVIKAHDEYIESADFSRRKLFIVDGDLDLLTESNRSEDFSFHVLDAYCIENYLIDRECCIKLAFYHHGEESLENCTSAFDYEGWLDSLIEYLMTLFFHLAILKEIDGDSTLRNAQEFTEANQNGHKLSGEKVMVYVDQLKNKYLIDIYPFVNDAQAHYDFRVSQLMKKWPLNRENLLKFVSGKSYLLPLLQFQINLVAGKKQFMSTKSLKMFLGDNCDLARLARLRNFILNPIDLN